MKMAYGWVKPHIRKGHLVRGHWKRKKRETEADVLYDRISERMYGKRYHLLTEDQQTMVYRTVMSGKRR